MVALAQRAFKQRQAILFKPSAVNNNSLCDICAVVPSTTGNAVVFLLFEVRDRRTPGFCKKLGQVNKAELLLAPVAEQLTSGGGGGGTSIHVEGTIFIPVTRTEFNVVP